VIRIGHVDGDVFDPRCSWLRHREITPGGAVLVRPDRFVAWRSLTANEEPRRVLEAALDQILGRSVTDRVRPRERSLTPSV
jgi:2,4-dichlorophenol 6-monooxygenase